MWPKSCLFVLVFGSRYTPIPMCAHTFADFVPEKHFLTLNILIFLLFLFAHTHTHIFCVNGLLLLPLLSLFCQFYSCVAYSVGGGGRGVGGVWMLSYHSLQSTGTVVFAKERQKPFSHIFMVHVYSERRTCLL